MKADEAYHLAFDSAIGFIGLRFQGDALTRIAFLEQAPAGTTGSRSAAHVHASRCLQRFVAGDPAPLDLPYLLDVSDFQYRVLRQLQEIPRGQVCSYGEIARRLQTSARAVGNACRRNPLPLLIPCHRVVAAGGIGGFAGARDGRLLAIKQRLLRNEGSTGR